MLETGSAFDIGRQCIPVFNSCNGKCISTTRVGWNDEVQMTLPCIVIISIGDTGEIIRHVFGG